MKNIKLLSTLFLLILLSTSCYDGYINDYSYTSTYFGTQTPLRTLVGDDDMSIEVGVVLAGMREDDGAYWVDYTIDTSLISQFEAVDTVLHLLPSNYYTLSDDANFDIVKDHMRTVKVTFNENFLNDPLAVDTHYVIPFRITSASVDSIANKYDTLSIDSRHLSFVAVRLISPYQGFYYSVGQQIKLDAQGNPTDTVVYQQSSMNQNDVVELSTVAINKVMTSRVGKNLTGQLTFTMDENHAVSTTSTDDIVLKSADVVYDEDENTYSLTLLLEQGGTTYKIIETLYLRQNPELDLRFEEWL